MHHHSMGDRFLSASVRTRLARAARLPITCGFCKGCFHPVAQAGRQAGTVQAITGCSSMSTRAGHNSFSIPCIPSHPDCQNPHGPSTTPLGRQVGARVPGQVV